MQLVPSADSSPTFGSSTETYHIQTTEAETGGGDEDGETEHPGSVAWALRQARPGCAALLLILALAACSSTGATASSGPASSAASPAMLKVTSTLDGHTGLPHRIRWQAIPIVPAADVSEVDFLIDGRLGWAEHHRPYFYGDDGNWLVTSFLTPACTPSPCG